MANLLVRMGVYRMTDGEELENQGFKVKDRRRFHADGSPVAETRPEPEATAAPEAGESPAQAGPAPEREGREIPADFSSLLLSIAAGAHSGLGLAPHPLTGKTERNLPQARYNIDLLGLLEE